ncbi:hypothetical protein FKW77_000876 [Venturia effusa]|uniref:Uncharacterized protein n=1 Tax=Venturia effusa TaxID=50376 RepID=A0A517LQI4_9PEZI|nr:hypothetical protein FKW77_000876 [Venturia effusa]
MLTVTPEGPEMVVMSVCAETRVDNVLPKPSVTALGKPAVTVATEDEEPELPEALPVDGAKDGLLVKAGDALSDVAEEARPDETVEPLSRVILPPPKTETTLPDAAEEATPDEPAEPLSRVTLPPPRTERTRSDAAEDTLPVGDGFAVADKAGDAAFEGDAAPEGEDGLEGEAEGPATGSVGDAPADDDEALLRADERLDSAEESTEASGGLRKSFPSDVGAGSPFVPARDPVEPPREISDFDAQTLSGMLRGGYCDGRGEFDGQVVVVVETVGKNGGVGAGVETTSVSNELSRDDVKVSGQTVVWTAVLRVTTATLLCLTGHLVSHGGQPSIVTMEVRYAVEVDSAGNRSTTTTLVMVLWMTDCLTLPVTCQIRSKLQLEWGSRVVGMSCKLTLSTNKGCNGYHGGWDGDTLHRGCKECRQ